MRNRPMTIFMAVAAVAGVVLVTASALAATIIEIPLRTIVRGDPGSVHRVAGPLEVAQVESPCRVELTRIDNNTSNHDGTNIIVRSGASVATFRNVEIPGWTGEAVHGFLLDGPVEVFTQIGPDEVSSMGYVVEITCSAQTSPRTTTTIPDVESTTTTEATPGATSTTSAPPVTVRIPVGVDTGRGAPPEGGVAAGGGPMVNGADPAILFYGGAVFLLLGAVLGIAAIAPRIRGGRK